MAISSSKCDGNEDLHTLGQTVARNQSMKADETPLEATVAPAAGAAKPCKRFIPNATATPLALNKIHKK